MTILLPENGEGFELRGRPDTEVAFGGERIVRHVELAGGRLRASEKLESHGGELPAPEVAQARTQVARASNSLPFLLAPSDAPRAWEYGRPDLKKRLASYEEAYGKAIARDREDAGRFVNRAQFRQLTGNLAGAIADLDEAIALAPDPETYSFRAYLKQSLGRSDAALADFRAAFELEPNGGNARALAYQLARMGGTDEALALLDDHDDYGEDHESFVSVRADVLAYDGRADDGLALIDELIAERPGKSYLLNSACWYSARFNVGRDTMVDTCNEAVQQGGNPAVLDSRALAWLTMGEPEKARADAEAALAASPDSYLTRYLLGFAQRRLGERTGEETISYIAETWPGVAQDYARYGLKP